MTPPPPPPKKKHIDKELLAYVSTYNEKKKLPEIFTNTSKNQKIKWEHPRDVIVKMLDCRCVVSLNSNRAITLILGQIPFGKL